MQSVYSSGAVSLIRKEMDIATEKAKKVAFNNAGKLVKLTRSNTSDEAVEFDFPSLNFEYTGERLSRYTKIGKIYNTDGNEKKSRTRL